MYEFQDEEKCILYNYTVIFLHVYKGLEYLHSKGIVHGDVKGSVFVAMFFRNVISIPEYLYSTLVSV